MSDDIRELLGGYITEALDLRFSGELPATVSTPDQVLQALLDTRRRIDRVEFLLGRAIRVRARAHRAASLATATVDDAWDRAAQHRRTGPVVRGDEYVSARERHADANLAVLDDRRAQRAATEIADHTDEAVDVLRLAHRGLVDLRHELLTMLRAVAFESHLER